VLKYKVTLEALAYVSQVVYIEASHEDEAIDIAFETCGNSDWKYGGIDDTSITGVAKECEIGNERK